MAVKKTKVQYYQNKEGLVLTESSKFEYEKRTFDITKGLYNLEDSKTEKFDVYKKFKAEYKIKDFIITVIDRELIAAPSKWLVENKYEKL